MTEVRPTTLGGGGDDVGLFATKSFDVGGVILKEESPLIVLTLPEEEMTLSRFLQTTTVPSNEKCSKKKKKKGKARSRAGKQEGRGSVVGGESIVPPPSIPSHQTSNFRGMVQAAISYSLQQQHCSTDVKERLFRLYRPTSSSAQNEREIVQVSNEALDYLRKNTTGDVKAFVTNHAEDVRNVMLIWSCNAFEGGRIYDHQSRINHSCNPNAIVQALDDGQQCIRAAVPIAIGDEVTISYLGLFLYADGPTRRHQLATHKHFVCSCERCCCRTTTPDVAAAIPCPSCHKRVSGRYLDEDVRYDDDGTVHYAIPSITSSSSLSPSLNSVECAHCHETTVLLNDKKPNHPLQLSRTVSCKVAAYLERQRNNDRDGEIEEELEEQLLQLASSVLGARHWTTNLLLLLRLDRTLQTLSSNMIASERSPDLVEVAELIDYLERLVRFVNGLQLKLHMGHALGNVVIGVARILVSLGDVKSKKYASEWLEKINGSYVVHFESNDMKKVVDTLAVAWRQGGNESPMVEASDDNDDVYESNKRAKLS